MSVNLILARRFQPGRSERGRRLRSHRRAPHQRASYRAARGGVRGGPAQWQPPTDGHGTGGAVVRQEDALV